MSNENTCERVDDLIGFLYGELSEMEARRFERHLSECVACTAEFKAFGQIRESIVGWRDQTLGLAGLPVAEAEPAVTTPMTQRRVPAKSAIAAVREFFALSPFWMRGATAFASLLFCVCAVLAVGYLKGRQPVVATSKTDKVYSEIELQARLAAERQNKQNDVAVSPVNKSEQQVDNHRPIINRSGILAVSKSPEVRNARRPFTTRERQELAADLRLVTAKDDDDLDLTIDSNRPTP